MSARNITLSVFALLLSLALLQCEKDNELKPAISDDKEFLCYSYNAADFIEHFKNINEDIYALQIKKSDRELRFELVMLDNHQLTTVETQQPQGNANTISLEGKVTPIAMDRIKEYEFQFWNGNFDFTLIPWQKIELMAHYSEKIYISGTKPIHGASIHAKQAMEANASYFSFKLEGDFEKTAFPDEMDVPLPMTSGYYCPPYWGQQGD